MCGIFGYNKKSNEEKNKIFFEMMKHRGPDAQSFIEASGWTLGHLRLSIIDTSVSANQPMQKNGNVLIFNGEIYNYIELKNEFLKNVKLGTVSDSEVLLELLNRFGTKILNKLNGMFAFAWYNKNNNELILCRDRYGVKPLNWMEKNGTVYFSSEIKPLAKIKKGVKFNNNLIESFIKDTATDFDNQTFIENIWQVEPGTLIKISNNKITIEKWYFNNDFVVDKEIFKDYHNTVSYYENLLTDAIKLRHRSDVPVCITLSGGLDSTTIYTLMKEKINSNLKPFTFLHPGSPTDESSKVFRLAQDYNDEVITIQSDQNKGIDDLREALYFLEFPIWNPSAIAYLDMYKGIHNKGFKVAIEGHGSDEQLGGYPYMIEAAWRESMIKGKFLQAHDLYKIYEMTLNPALNQTAGNSKNNLKNYLYMLKILTKLSVARFIKPSKINYLNFQSVLDDSFHYKILPIVLRSFDRLSMSQSIESRSPFMDFRLVEFTRALPLINKVNKIGGKAILREILKKYKKDYLYQNKIKMGFASDLPSFFNNEKTKEALKKYISSFGFKGHENLKDKALKKINGEKISWADTEPIWKVASLEIIKNLYENY